MADEKISLIIEVVNRFTKGISNFKKQLSEINKSTKDVGQQLNKMRYDFLGLGFMFATIAMQLNNLFNESSNFIGISQRMAEVVGGGLPRAVADTNARFQEMKMELLSALAPAMIEALGVVRNLMDGFVKLSQNPIVSAILGWLVVFAPAISIMSFMVLGVTTIIHILSILVGILGGPVTIAIIAAIAIFTLLALNWDKISGWIAGATEWLAEKFNAAWDWIVNGLKSAWEWISNIFSSIVSGIGNALNNVWKVMVAVFNYLWTGWTGFWGGVAKFVLDIWNNIITYIQNGLNGVINMINGLIDKYNSIASKVMMPQIGKLGNVDLGSLRADTGANNSTTNNINITVETGGAMSESLAQEIGDIIAQKVSRGVNF